MLARKALAGTAGAPKAYVEEVFSTYLYTGNGSTQTITNNIDLSGEGGLVWTKNRDTAGTNHILCDTGRGITNYINSNNANGQNANGSLTDVLTATTSTGYSLGADATLSAVNVNAKTYVSWTFRKAEKFFDVVTYTGNGTTQAISHNLGSAPGSVWVKSTSAGGTNWFVWHRSLTSGYYIYLNTTGAQTNANNTITFGNNTTTVDPTSTNFTIGSNGNINDSGQSYVAYLFAHDAGGFGDAGSDSIIKCDTFTTNGSGAATVTLNWEPQWVMFKRTDSSTNGDWEMFDNMRGLPATGTGSIAARLRANLSSAENASTGDIKITSTGFVIDTVASATYIYIAIRRGPMKTPTSGTSVYKALTYAGGSAPGSRTGVGFPPDMLAMKRRDDIGGFIFGASRILVSGSLLSSSTDAFDSTNTNVLRFDQDGFSYGSPAGLATATSGVVEFFRRAPGFFDVVCYTGTGSNINVNHNLGVGPELVIVKRRDSTSDWQVAVKVNSTQYAIGASGDELRLNSSGGASTTYYTYSTYFNSTTFGTGAFWTPPNVNGATYVAYLFASVSGVSKVGSYTGNGSSVTVTTGFQPRFILVKRTDSTGSWIVSDSARGLVSGDDPYLLLNASDAEVTNEDWVDVSSTGFTVNQTTNNANVNTGTYIYLCIA